DGQVERLLRRFRIETSVDGVAYQPVFEGRLSSAKIDQAFVFDAPVEARFARLVAIDSHRGQVEGYFGEWKLIAEETELTSGLDLATPELGGHVVWSRPLLSAGDFEDLLTGAGAIGRVDLAFEDAFSFAVGFQGTRAAMIRSISLTQPEAAAEQLFDTVEIAVILTGAVGPWRPLTEAELRAAGTTTSIDLAVPSWARYVQFTFPKRDDQ